MLLSGRLVLLANAARVFGLVVVGVPAALLGERDGLVVTLVLAVIWAVAMAASSVPRLRTTTVLMAEAAVVGTVCAVALDSTDGFHLTALAVVPFVAGLRRGFRAVAEAIGAELVAFTVAAIQIFHAPLSARVGAQVFTAVVLGLGLGLVAGFLHAYQSQGDDLSPYREARTLISQLRSLSDRLSSGLDVVSLGEQVLVAVEDALPVAGVGLYVPSDDDLRPVTAHSAPGGDVAGDQLRWLALARFAWASERTQLEADGFALPLVSEQRIVGVVAGTLAPGLNGDLARRLVAALGPRLRGEVVQLDTGLLFEDVRLGATAEERQRLAREMHDGMAQDLASMGYLVDMLREDATTPEQADQLRLLRETITNVVAEVRQSVTTLREDPRGTREQLGPGLGRVARHLEQLSGTPISVEVRRTGTHQLGPDVQAELLRIGQEAMTNAVKHAHADAISVRLSITDGGAVLEVSDDGVGLQPGRPDSYGLKIMAERAQLVGARLEVGRGADGGTVVRAALGEDVDLPTRLVSHS